MLCGKLLDIEEEEWVDERRSIHQARCVCAHTIHSAMGSVVRSGPELMKADRLCVWCAAAGAHHPLSIFIDVHPKE